MTTRELDRLVSRTELDNITKKALRPVRKAVMTGRATDPAVGSATWTIGVVGDSGTSFRFVFSLRKDSNGN